ncbi:MAG: hypothetical protein JNL70_11515 [Saprospiraceae bacterium]|nr:hypothetical protein [Saprospiraceae bacterium]
MRINYWQTFYEGCFYHIYNRAIGRAWLFANDENNHYFLKKWKQYIHPYIETYAYCLMVNHFHFLVRVRRIDNAMRQQIEQENTVASRKFLNGEIEFNTFLEDQFKRLFSAYTLAYNKQQSRHGSLFQESFKRIQIGNEVKLINTLCYIHHNPIHHDASPFYDVWTFSSFKAYLSQANTLIERQEGLKLFDGMGVNSKAFENYHETYRQSKTAFRQHIDEDDNLIIDGD